MTTYNLDRLLQPRSVALVCAPKEDDASLLREKRLIRNLFRACFKGPVMPVSPKREAVEGVLAYPSIAELPRTPDLTVACVGPAEAPTLLEELGQKGSGAAILLNTGDHELDSPDHEESIAEIAAVARKHGIRLLGPGGIGVAVPGVGLNALMARGMPREGSIAFVARSSGVARAALSWATAYDVGLSHLVSLGAAADVDYGDMLDYLAGVPTCRTVLLQLEKIGNPRKFMSAARRLARVKPVLVLKPRHDGSETEPDNVFEAAFRRAGVLRVRDLPELFATAATLSRGTNRVGNRLAIIANSRSLAQLGSETLTRLGGRRADLGGESAAATESQGAGESHSENPICLGENADADAFVRALETTLKAKHVDGALVINSPSPLVDETAVADAIARQKPASRRCLMVAWADPNVSAKIRQLFNDKRIPTFLEPGEAVRAYMRLVQYRHNQELLMETPASIPEAFDPDTARAEEILAEARRAGREWLNEYQAIQLLQAYTIPVVRTEVARDADEAAALADGLGGPAALKIMSPAVASKSDVAGIRLGLNGAAEVRDCALRMLESLRASKPEAEVDGFVVQPMEHRHGAFEITAGALSGTRFGPVIRFGQGGTEYLQIDDLAYGLPPLNMNLAREIMLQTRIYPRLLASGIRAANIESVALILIKLSQIVVDLPLIKRVHINPIWARPSGAVALDAKVAIATGPASEPHPLAIKPYPKELEEAVTLADGREFLLRPIRPEDEPPMQRMIERNPSEHLRMRFFQALKELPHTLAAELTQIDYDREMALVLTDPGQPGQAEVWGGVRMIAEPTRKRAEYAIMIDHTLAGMGVGSWLMNKIIDYARSCGIQELWGEVLRENKGMLKLNSKFGFEVKPLPEDRSLMHVSLRLG